jgi:hypothetical protein
MNIDDLKDAWGKDEPKGMKLLANAEMLGKTTSVVSRLRKNMKSEFNALLVSYAIIVVFLFKGNQSPFFFNMSIILLFSILVLNCFYYLRFYAFYKSVSRYDVNMRSSIRKIVYELELNAEIYKTYSFSVVPLSVLTTITLISSKVSADFLNKVLNANGYLSWGVMLMIFSIVLISFTLSYIFITIHVRSSYGKYLAELKKVMNDLGDDD